MNEAIRENDKRKNIKQIKKDGLDLAWLGVAQRSKANIDESCGKRQREDVLVWN